MPTYNHLQEAKKSETLPEAEKLGVCLTCKYWEVEENRATSLVNQLAVCVQPQLKPYALLVSGSSGCNKWQEKAGVAPEAKQYAEQGK